MHTRTSGLLLGLPLTISAYGQPPSAPVAVAEPASAATAYVIKFKVKPGKSADFQRAVGEMMAGVREQEPGNVYCELLRFPGDSQTYVIVERYTDTAASKAHVESAYIKKLGDTLKSGLLDGPPEPQGLVFIRSK